MFSELFHCSVPVEIVYNTMPEELSTSVISIIQSVIETEDDQFACAIRVLFIYNHNIDLNKS